VNRRSDRLHVGVHVGHLELGNRGGTDVYKQELVAALMRYGRRHNYAIILDADAAVVHEGTSSTNVRFCRISSNKMKDHFAHAKWIISHKVRRRYADLVSYIIAERARVFCRQLDLDLLHFPATIIPREYWGVKERCILTYFDMQHEFYQEFFTTEMIRLLRQNHRTSVDKAYRVICPSAFTARTLAEKYEVPGKKIAYLPVGVWTSDKRVSADRIGAVRRKYGLPERYLFYPANPWPHKNHAGLIEALVVYKQKYKEEISLVLTGRLKDSEWSAQAMASKAGIGKQVFDLGFVPKEDMAALNSGASLMVFPSLFEGFGMPLLEAMSCGCPIAAACSTSIPEIVGDAALLFDPTKSVEIAECIYRMLSDQALADDLVKKGHKRAALYLWSEVIPKMEDFYHEVSQVV
jgi:glycosyltransferase involved in cell wall biosynthesis